MIDIDIAVRRFRSVLSCSWPHLSALGERDKTGSFLDDWMQANWEMIVESSIPPELAVNLEVYGEGADCNGASSRVWKASALPTHHVICVPNEQIPLTDILTGAEIEGHHIFDAFCIIKNDWISYAPPFNCVSLQDPEQRVISCDEVRFEAHPIQN